MHVPRKTFKKFHQKMCIFLLSKISPERVLAWIFLPEYRIC